MSMKLPNAATAKWDFQLFPSLLCPGKHWAADTPLRPLPSSPHSPVPSLELSPPKFLSSTPVPPHLIPTWLLLQFQPLECHSQLSFPGCELHRSILVSEPRFKRSYALTEINQWFPPQKQIPTNVAVLKPLACSNTRVFGQGFAQ